MPLFDIKVEENNTRTYEHTHTDAWFCPAPVIDRI